jgi:type III secretory pathway component EscT
MFLGFYSQCFSIWLAHALGSGIDSKNGIYKVAVAVQRQSVIHTENSGFASPTLGQHISTFRGYRILFSIINPYINIGNTNICLFVYMQIISHDTLR